MIANSLPPELRELEHRLCGRRGDEPTPGLRDRVMRAVTAELAIPQPAPPANTWDAWHWFAIAASVFVVLNLSMISASRNEFSTGSSADSNQLASELRAMRIIEQNGNFK